MDIQPITLTKTFSTSYSLEHLDDSHVTYDDTVNKVLTVELREAVPPQVITIAGEEYDTLGQWTDESLNQFLVTKFGLTPV